jgi:hypothetical protein
MNGIAVIYGVARADRVSKGFGRPVEVLTVPAAVKFRIAF